MKTRVCSVCKVEKFVEEFHREKRKPVGYAAACRMCINKADRERHRKKKNRTIEPPERAKARKAVKDAVRRGELTKPTKCQGCFETFPKHLIHGHHHDYSKPLEVTWLCAPCHGLEHMDESAVRAELRRLRLMVRKAA